MNSLKKIWPIVWKELLSEIRTKEVLISMCFFAFLVLIIFNFAFFSSKAGQPHWNLKFHEDLFLVFGKESIGLPHALIEKNIEASYKIPIRSQHIRSLNLANAVSIIVYHGLYQLGHKL